MQDAQRQAAATTTKEVMVSEQEHSSKETAGDDLGPKEGTDDSTKSDMGMTGPPAQSATPVGQGEGPGAGAEGEPAEDGAEERP